MCVDGGGGVYAHFCVMLMDMGSLTVSLTSSLSDRSFNDIMQYPVMPWIIADYTSTKLGTMSLCNDHYSSWKDFLTQVGFLLV